MCRALPRVDAGMCLGLPWSTGINRDVPGRDSEILNMLGPSRWSSLPGSAMRAPCWRRPRGSAMFTPGCTVLTPGCTVSLSLPLCRFSAGVYRVRCGLRHGLDRNNHLPSSCQTSFLLFVFFSGFSSMLTQSG